MSASITDKLDELITAIDLQVSIARAIECMSSDMQPRQTMNAFATVSTRIATDLSTISEEVQQLLQSIRATGGAA